MKLDKDRIKSIALNRFHDKHFDTPIDLILFALDVWLKEEKLEIKKVPDEEMGGKSDSAGA